MDPDELFERVVAATRLNKLVAPFTVRRLLIKADVDVRRLDLAGVERALPVFEQGLATFLTEAELGAAMADLRELAAASTTS